MATFHIHTFGCKVNQCDSQILRETLLAWGLAEAEANKADLVVINSCTVTGAADSKFQKALRRTKRENSRALTVLTGCFANREVLSLGKQLAADLIVKIRDFQTLADFLFRQGIIAAETTEKVLKQSYFAEHTRAFLKIQDGCDCFCSYCIVPIVRPELWSEDPQNVIEIINRLSSRGYKEVVLTGIHLGFFGRDKGRDTLPSLLDRIENECDIDRVRLSSIEINEVSGEILRLVASSKKFCHHFHLPLQSGNDEILKKMGRRYSSASFVKRVEEIRREIPDIGISTDIVVGFPGETDGQFESTVQVVKKAGFVKIHVFRFSPRPGTKANEMESSVPSGIINSRARRMISVGESTAQNFKESLMGKTIHVLAESYDNDEKACIGLSSNYIRVKVLDASQNCLNRILPVRLIETGSGTGPAIGRLS